MKLIIKSQKRCINGTRMNILKYIFITLICFFNFLSRPLSGQNLLPNPSFEDMRPAAFLHPIYWSAATNEGWNYLTPYNNTYDSRYSAPENVSGYQEARSGKAYIGMSLMHLYSFTPSKRNTTREYLQTKLKRPLKADSTYCFQIYVSLADSMRYASRGLLGVYFSKTAVHGNHRQWLPYTPQIVLSPHQYLTDKDNWVKYSGTYKAMGGEEYLTMGNFNDTTIIDTLFVKGGEAFYYMRIYCYLDDIFLGSCDSLPDSLSGVAERFVEEKMRMYPNPSRNLLNIDFETTKEGKYQFELYDMLGKKVYGSAIQQNSKHKIVVDHLQAAMYFYRLIHNQEVIKTGKIVVE